MFSFPECKLPLYLTLRRGGGMRSYFCCHSYLYFFFIPGIRNQNSGQVCGVKLDAGASLRGLYCVPRFYDVSI